MNRFVVIICAAYVLLASVNIGFLAGFVGDEAAYRAASLEILDRGPESNLEHPLLAKTVHAFAAAVCAVFDVDFVVGMRLASVVAGLVALIAVCAIAARFAGPGRAAAAPAGILFLSGTIFWVHARLVSLDMISLALMSAALYWFLRAQPAGQSAGAQDRNAAFLAGAFLGLSLAAKWMAIWIVPWMAARFLIRKEFRAAAGFFACLALFYIAGNAAFFINHSPADLIAWHARILSYHQTSAPLSAENGSPAWSWFTVPQLLYYARIPMAIPPDPPVARMVLGAVNPVVFLLAVPAILWGFRPRASAAQRLLAEASVCLYVPWLFVSRPTYLFYLLPILPPLACLQAMLLMSVAEQGTIGRVVSRSALVAAVALFALFYPLSAGMPASESYERFAARFNFYSRPVHHSMFCLRCNAFFGSEPAP